MNKSALDGITVLDLSRILAGPWASQMLADLGAEVIKVEKPQVGDDTRKWGPPFVETTEQSDAAYFHCANRNKSSIAIDITRKEGQQLIIDLAKKADVFIENYKVGGLAKYGLDYVSLKQINPKLVYCSITGFGQSGPCAHRAGYDAMIQGEGGLMSITGEPDGMPMKVGVALVDVMTGLYSSNAILAALLARHHTHEGQYIDISLLDVQLAALANQGMNYLTTGENPSRLGNGHPNIVPYQTFSTSDGALILAIGNDQQFEKFCQLTNLSELSTDPRYTTNQARVENRNSLIPMLAQKLTTQTTQWWVDELTKISVPCGPVNKISQVVSHPQIQHRQMIRSLPASDGQKIKTVANPINLSETPVSYHKASPSLGEDTKRVLKEYLSKSEREITELIAAGTIA